MAGFAVGSSHTVTASHHDHSHCQRQLLSPAEATRALVPPSLRSKRKNRACISIAGLTQKLSPAYSEDGLPAHSKPRSRDSSSSSLPELLVEPSVFCTTMSSPAIGREGRPFAFRMYETLSHPRPASNAEAPTVCATTKPTLDRCINNAGDATSSQMSVWREEGFSTLQRSLLESQWDLESTQRSLRKERTSNGDDPNCISNDTQKSGGAVVRSGQASARQRRLSSRLEPGSRNKEGSLKTLGFTIPAKLQSKRKKGKLKPDALQDFISFFLKPTNGLVLLSKDQERGYTRQMRICQSLEKAKRELTKKLGYDPPHELWAQSVNISTEELLSMVKKGEVARTKMLYSHLRLVVSVARSYQKLGVDMNDLIQEGSIGLLRGLEKFDHRRGNKLSTYVHCWIRKSVTRAIANHSRMVRVPVYLHVIMFAIKRAKAALAIEGKSATVENLSLLLKVPSYKIERALHAKTRIISLDRTDNSYGLKMEYSGLHEFVADRNRENQPWDSLNEEDMMVYVRTRMSRLTPKEQKVIGWTFGIGTEGGVQSGLTAVARKLGISKERVRQLKARALCKMRWGTDRDLLSIACTSPCPLTTALL